MEYGSAFGHGAYLGPGLHRRLPAPRVRPRQARLRRRRARTRRARRTIADFRTNRYDKRTRHADADRAAGRTPSARLVPYYSRFFSDPTTEHGLRPNAITDPHAAAPADRVLRLDGVGGVDQPPRPRLLLHQQLAARAARRQQADRQRDRLVGAVADRAAGRHRRAVRRLRALGAPARLARPRAGHAVASARPATSRSRPAQRATRVVLLRDGGAVPDPDARRRRVAALPRRDRQLLRLRPGAGLPLQPDAHLARPARAVLGGDLVRRGRHLPGADDRPARAQAPGHARLRAARRAGRRRVRDADRLLPRHPRRAPGRRVELVRPAGLRVPRPRAALAGPAVDRAVRLGVHALARPAPAAATASTRATCRGCSSWRRARSRPSTPSG